MIFGRERVSLSELRGNHPTWKWSSVRVGFGWEYKGLRGSEVVTVYGSARIVDEDAFKSEWRVRDAEGNSELYLFWSCREANK